MTRTAEVLNDADYIASVIYGGIKRFVMAREALASCAIEGNEIASRCGVAIDRLLSGKVISQAETTELASMLRNIFDGNN